MYMKEWKKIRYFAWNISFLDRENALFTAKWTWEIKMEDKGINKKMFNETTWKKQFWVWSISVVCMTQKSEEVWTILYVKLKSRCKMYYYFNEEKKIKQNWITHVVLSFVVLISVFCSLDCFREKYVRSAVVSQLPPPPRSRQHGARSTVMDSQILLFSGIVLVIACISLIPRCSGLQGNFLLWVEGH